MTNDQGQRTAEWFPHEACWLAWPSHEKEWGPDLEAAQAEFVQLCRAISAGESGERLEILVLDEAGKTAAAQAIGVEGARFHIIPFGDIWLRDIGPIFRREPGGKLAAVRFDFNGWGEKYVFPGDAEVATNIIKLLDVPEFYFPVVVEGGALEFDGEGTCLTTRSCLLNPNRNPNASEAEIEAILERAFGVSKVLWLNQGLLNDHTDGHIDTLARFVAPGTVLCMAPVESDDPNQEVLAEIARDLSEFTDARGRRLEVHQIPSPGRILNDWGEVMPASYMNFYIANNSVVVPTYGSPQDDVAVAEIARFFPNRRTVGLPSKAILTGGGSFHCITQEQPLVSSP